MDGHTKEGSWLVNVVLTADEVEMGVRAMRTALLFSGSGKNASDKPLEEKQLVEFRQFINGIIDKFETARQEQQP